MTEDKGLFPRWMRIITHTEKMIPLETGFWLVAGFQDNLTPILVTPISLFLATSEICVTQMLFHMHTSSINDKMQMLHGSNI